MPVARAFEWYREALQLFKRHPFAFVGLAVAVIAAELLLGVVPVVGRPLANIVVPILACGLLYASLAADRGDRPRAAHLVAAFAAPVASLGAVILASLVVFLAEWAIGWQFAGVDLLATDGDQALSPGDVLLIYAAGVAVSLPLTFVPIVALFEGAGVADSFAASVAAFRRNDTFLLWRFGRSDPANQAVYQHELQGMVDHLHNAACIAVWVPFNESWGQFQALETARWLKAYDPTRLVDHASGWFDQGGGDFQSKHIYFKPLYRPNPDERAFVISEFGGYSLKIPGHVWDEDKKFGYRFYGSPAELTEAYLDLLENQVRPLISQGLAAAIYTETTDVEIEINGYLTYDRLVEKMDAEALCQAHQALIAAGSLP